MPERTFDKWEPSGGSDTEAIETHYMTLPGNAPDIIRTVLGADPKLKTDDVAEIFKPDKETVEIVYYNDTEATVDRETRRGKRWDVNGTKVPDSVRQAIQDLLQSYYGPAWLVARKPDKREYSGCDRQRLWVRRVQYTDFKYDDETYADARKIIEGVDVRADRYGEMREYPRPDDVIVNDRVNGGDDDSPPETWPLDVYVYQTTTGTAHLLGGRKFRETHVVDDPTCLCGRSIPAEDARDGKVYHFADYVRRFKQGFPAGVSELANDVDVGADILVAVNLNPMQVLRDDLCVSCAKDYCDVRRSSFSDKIRDYQTPMASYNRLKRWDDGRVDDLEWEPIATDQQLEDLGGVVQ